MFRRLEGFVFNPDQSTKIYSSLQSTETGCTFRFLLPACKLRMKPIHQIVFIMMRPEKPIEWVIKRQPILFDLKLQGIFSLQQLADMPLEDLQAIKGIGPKTAPRIKALAWAFVLEGIVRFGQVPSEYQTLGAVLDVRVDPDTRPQTPWGFCLRNPTGKKQFMLLAPDAAQAQVQTDRGRNVTLVSHFHLAWRCIADLLDELSCPLWYWGKNVLKHLHETAAQAEQERLLPRTIDLHKVFLDTVAIPIRSTGLQPVAKTLGYDDWGAGWEPFKAHINYMWWLKDKQKSDALELALLYMEQNVEAVVHIWRWLTARQGE